MSNKPVPLSQTPTKQLQPTQILAPLQPVSLPPISTLPEEDEPEPEQQEPEPEQQEPEPEQHEPEPEQQEPETEEHEPEPEQQSELLSKEVSEPELDERFRIITQNLNKSILE